MSVSKPQKLLIIFNGKVNASETAKHVQALKLKANVPFSAVISGSGPFEAEFYTDPEKNGKILSAVPDYFDDDHKYTVKDEYDPVEDALYITVTTNDFS
jgi:hypothetical protein